MKVSFELCARSKFSIMLLVLIFVKFCLAERVNGIRLTASQLVLETLCAVINKNLSSHSFSCVAIVLLNFSHYYNFDRFNTIEAFLTTALVIDQVWS